MAPGIITVPHCLTGKEVETAASFFGHRIWNIKVSEGGEDSDSFSSALCLDGDKADLESSFADRPVSLMQRLPADHHPLSLLHSPFHNLTSFHSEA